MNPYGTFCTGAHDSLEIQSVFTNQKLWGKLATSLRLYTGYKVENFADKSTWKVKSNIDFFFNFSDLETNKNESGGFSTLITHPNTCQNYAQNLKFDSKKEELIQFWELYIIVSNVFEILADVSSFW